MSGEKTYGPVVPPIKPAATSSPTSGEGSDSAMEVLRKKRQMGISVGDASAPIAPMPPAPAAK